MNDTIAQELGFVDADEFFRLVASPDLTKPGAFDRFAKWKTDDGSKVGLLVAFPDLGA